MADSVSLLTSRCHSWLHCHCLLRGIIDDCSVIVDSGVSWLTAVSLLTSGYHGCLQCHCWLRGILADCGVIVDSRISWLIVVSLLTTGYHSCMTEVYLLTLRYHGSLRCHSWLQRNSDCLLHHSEQLLTVVFCAHWSNMCTGFLRRNSDCLGHCSDGGTLLHEFIPGRSYWCIRPCMGGYANSPMGGYVNSGWLYMPIPLIAYNAHQLLPYCIYKISDPMETISDPY